jgi:hypothetical protein
MPAYRCTLLDGAKQVQAVEHIECEHDAEALIRTINILEDQTRYQFAEIWCGPRIVARLPKRAAMEKESSTSEVHLARSA